MLQIPIYKQSDPSWGNLPLDSSNYNMAGSGCLVTSIAMSLWGFGHQITPGDLCEAFNAIPGGFSKDDGMMSEWLINLVPGLEDMEFDAIEETDLDGSKDKRVKMSDAINAITTRLSEGKTVILHVDLSPHNNINDGDHFVLCYDWNGGDPKIHDPWFGTDTVLSEKYGKPTKSIYGYRMLNTKQQNMPQLNVAENTLIQLTDPLSTGGFGLYANGKLYIDEIGKILASWEVRNGGDTRGKTLAVNLKDWNNFSHVDLKNNPIN